MRDLSEASLTEAVITSMANAQDERTKVVLTSLVKHLHAFIREVNLTEAEWLAGIQFLTATGQMCDPKRQEFILLSDTLGVTTMKDIINNRKPPGVTEYTILGPFHRTGAPQLALGDNLAKEMRGEPVVMRGRVLAPNGQSISNATLDVWQSDAEGHYDLQIPDLDGTALRGVFHSDTNGAYHFRTIKPSYYPIPNDGPVGQLLTATGRHPYRPAHIHFIISAEGYEPVTTELFIEGDPYLDSDPVFGVRASLVVQPVQHNSLEEAEQYNVTAPFDIIEYDFVLKPL